jgi:hypothetical protein
MPDADQELLTFEEFREKIGAAEHAVRRAIREMKLRPIPLLKDMRRTGYKQEWVEEVKQWLLEHRISS